MIVNPLISIIVPCYNQAQYLDECLQSVLEQTYTDWECIIVNDGSPDNTEEIARKWVEKDSRFKYLHQENGGVAAARNYGIKNALGTWILPLDGDDKIAAQYIELASKKMIENYDIIYCKAEYFGDQSGEVILQSFNEVLILLENQIFVSAFFPKKNWELVHGFDEELKGFEDWDFWLSMLENKNHLKVHCLSYYGFFYRIKKSSRNKIAYEKHAQEILISIHQKHAAMYNEKLEHYSKYVTEQPILKLEIQKLQNKLSSKRYKYINALFKFIKK